MRGIINHDYIVVELVPKSGDNLHILAEKRSEGPPGIHVRKAVPAEYKDECVVTLDVNCYDVPMDLNTIEECLLQADTPDYNVKTHNCWDYATIACKQLLKCVSEFAVDVGTKEQLLKQLTDLNDNLLRAQMFNAWKIVENLVKAGFSGEISLQGYLKMSIAHSWDL